MKADDGQDDEKHYTTDGPRLRGEVPAVAYEPRHRRGGHGSVA